MRRLLVLWAAWAAWAPCAADYRKAPPAIRKILDAEPAPAVQVVPGGKALLLAYRKPYPCIDDLAQPFQRLAGLRIDPVALGPICAAPAPEARHAQSRAVRVIEYPCHLLLTDVLGYP
ncbi:MAG: hypothetical protein K2W96_12145 [Gemmataceae bacterium]|nr:hypothetical protein [Gemmataceae bacterium]